MLAGVGNGLKEAVIDAGTFADVPLFRAVGAQTLERLAADARIVTIRGGEDLFRSGDVADGLYVLRAGRLRVLVEDGEGAARRPRARSGRRPRRARAAHGIAALRISPGSPRQRAGRAGRGAVRLVALRRPPLRPRAAPRARSPASSLRRTGDAVDPAARLLRRAARRGNGCRTARRRDRA